MKQHNHHRNAVSRRSFLVLAAMLAGLVTVNTGAVLHAQKGAVTVDWKKLRELNYQTGKMSADIRRLNGKLVKVPGFMVPLEDEQEAVTEFLLVPYPQACIHVPAPPPNQIVHVKMKRGKKAKVYYYEPIWIYGTLKIEKASSIYAESSYTLDGSKAELYAEPFEEY
ncbi:MAG: DUF3299 domain-containing protein [bacterium]|nr:DUF3299 domain-containing protein [bacterium]